MMQVFRSILATTSQTHSESTSDGDRRAVGSNHRRGDDWEVWPRGAKAIPMTSFNRPFPSEKGYGVKVKETAPIYHVRPGAPTFKNERQPRGSEGVIGVMREELWISGALTAAHRKNEPCSMA